MNQTIHDLKTRRSIRKFTDEPVDHAHKQTIRIFKQQSGEKAIGRKYALA